MQNLYNVSLNLVKCGTLCAVEEEEEEVLVVLDGTRETMIVDTIVAMTEATIAMTTEMAIDLTGQLGAKFLLNAHLEKFVFFIYFALFFFSFSFLNVCGNKKLIIILC